MVAPTKIASFLLLLSATAGLSSYAMAQDTVTAASLVKKRASWKGTITYKGTYKSDLWVPTDYDCTFTFTDGDDKSFKGEFKVSQGPATAPTMWVTYNVSGKITAPAPGAADGTPPPAEPFTINWTADTVKEVSGTTAISRKISYKGTFTSDKISGGTWNLADANKDETLGGTFDLKRQ